MEEVETCIYCGANDRSQGDKCPVCQQMHVPEEVDIKLLTDALNSPLLLKDISSGCLFNGMIFFGLLGIVTGFSRFEALAGTGSVLLAYLLIGSGLIMVFSLIALRFKAHLIFVLMFAIGTAVQGIILIISSMFLSSNFFIGIMLLIASGLVFWRVPQIVRVRNIPKPILDHAMKRRDQIFTPKKEDVPVLLLFKAETGSDENVWRLLVEQSIAMIGFEYQQRIRVLPRSQFSITPQGPFATKGETKVTVQMEGKSWAGKISPAPLEKPKVG
jgi:hypothetical protein